MNYQNFKLSAKRLDLISNHLAKKKVEKYIKENGVEPTPEIEATFYDVTPEEKEKYRLVFFANDFVDESEQNIDVPAGTPNTPEQNEVEEDIINTLLNGTTGYTADSINNITLPPEVNVIPRITGNFQDGATITNESTKSLYLFNTSEEPIDITILTNSTSVYLAGNFNNVYYNGKTLNGTSGNYPVINGELDLVPSTSGSVNVYANFQENSIVKYLGNQPLNVYHQTNKEGNVKVYAPNSTVTMSGTLDEVEATVSDDTLILRYSFNCNKLKVNKGNVIYQGIDEHDFYNELIGENVNVAPYGFAITGNNITNTTSTPGVYTVTQDFSNNKAVVFGIFASGRYRYDLNGHHATFGDSTRGNFLIRNAAQVDFIDSGEGGRMTNASNSYGIWSASEGVVVNVYGGTYEAYSHVLYAEKGRINVYGGTFKCLSEDKRYTLNCLDSSFTAETAKITVYGGKFYNYNPAESMSEPGGPVSFLADGYTVRSYQEGDDTIYEVIPQE